MPSQYFLIIFVLLASFLGMSGCGVKNQPVPYVDSHPPAQAETKSPAPGEEKK